MISSSNILRKPNRKEIVFAAFFLAVLVFNIWRAPYGEVWDDEAYYLTVPYRMMQGDSFLVHEWSMGQMFGFILLPLVKLYVAVFQSTDGIYLASRYAYVVTHTLTSLYIFLRLRNINFSAAAVSALIYFIFSYGNLMTLNYNTMGIGLMLICWLTMAMSRGKAWEYMLSGLCFAAAVLCSPFLVMVYLAYTLAVLIIKGTKKQAVVLGDALLVRSWLLFTASCAILATAFFLRTILNGDFLMIFRTLPELLQEDYHPRTGTFWFIREFIAAFSKQNGYFWQVLAGSLVLCLVIAMDRRAKGRRALYLIAAACLAGLFALPYVLMYREVNYLLFPVNILGFFAYLLCEKKNYRLFWLMYVPGAIYWLAINMASNLGLLAISGASAVNIPASMVFVFELISELREDAGAGRGFMRLVCNVAALCSVGVVLMCTAVMLDTRMERAVFSDPIDTLTERIEMGAAKGVICTPEQKALYEGEYTALAPLREKAEGKVLYFDRNSIRHIEDEKINAHHNMWFAYKSIENAEAKLEIYWELLPERKPDYIYLNDEGLSDPEVYNMFCTAFDYDYTIIELEHGAFFELDWH